VPDFFAEQDEKLFWQMANGAQIWQPPYIHILQILAHKPGFMM